MHLIISPNWLRANDSSWQRRAAGEFSDAARVVPVLVRTRERGFAAGAACYV